MSADEKADLSPDEIRANALGEDGGDDGWSEGRSVVALGP